MKTLTLHSDELHKQLKLVALKEDKTLNDVIIEAIEDYIKSKSQIDKEQ